MRVPFLDLNAYHRRMMPEIEKAIHNVIDQSAFAGGPFVEAFENEFARFCGVDHAVGVGSGTDALHIALAALGIGAGDEVITVPNTFVATVAAICMCGARPVLVDVDPKTYTIDPRELENAITSRTKAVIPVHLFGRPAEMDAVLAVAERHALAVVEDACQAHGALYRGRPAGSMGKAGCFSFYPGKNLGAIGEAGAVVTRDPALAERMRMLRDHGQRRKYYHDLPGWNGRMDGIQGAILSVKLAYLPEANAARRDVATLYDEWFAGIEGIVTPERGDDIEHVYHLYAVRVSQRDMLMQTLAKREIGYGIHYPVPVHLQPAYKWLGYGQGSFPVAERYAEEFLSLPMYPDLRVAQVNEVGGVVIASINAERKPATKSLSMAQEMALT